MKNVDGNKNRPWGDIIGSGGATIGMVCPKKPTQTGKTSRTSETAGWIGFIGFGIFAVGRCFGFL